jgi:uncharacterized LabA/DUF88 family protein
VRAVVFIDHQNMYKGAREAFGWKLERGHYGNFKPLALARLLAPEAEHELAQVRIYTGVPHPEHNRLGHAITQRRIEAWRLADPERVHVFPRTLRYPPPEGREKGVDVHLAVDLVRLAIEDAYELLILCSADTDLVPALEFVHGRFPEKRIETVAWNPIRGCEPDTAAPLDIPGGGVTRRRVSLTEFERLIDRTNYVLQASERRTELPGQSGRRLPPGRR